MNRVFSIGVLVMSVLFLGAGCTFKFGSGDGSVFKSTDRGQKWESKSLMLLPKGRQVRLTNVDVTKILIDPRDSNRIFMGTKAHGLFASENGAENWLQLIPGEFINDIAIDPLAKCVLYAIGQARILKTTDCAQHWEVIYNETRTNVFVTSMLIDPFSSNVLYAVTTGGDIFKSIDTGSSWLVQSRLPGEKIEKILADKWDQNLLYLATRDGKIYRSSNRGIRWDDISGPLKVYPESNSYTHMDVLTTKDGLFFASQHALFKTKDGGKSWEKINVLVPGGSVQIFSAAVNPVNTSELYYATQKTLYRTSDNGYQWVAQPHPSARVPSALSIDPNNSSIVYLGAKTVAETAKYWYNPSQ